MADIAQQSVAFSDDLEAALKAIGLDWPADPRSPHRVFLEELLPRVRALRALYDAIELWRATPPMENGCLTARSLADAIEREYLDFREMSRP